MGGRIEVHPSVPRSSWVSRLDTLSLVDGHGVDTFYCSVLCHRSSVYLFNILFVVCFESGYFYNTLSFLPLLISYLSISFFVVFFNDILYLHQTHRRRNLWGVIFFLVKILYSLLSKFALLYTPSVFFFLWTFLRLLPDPTKFRLCLF